MQPPPEKKPAPNIEEGQPQKFKFYFVLVFYQFKHYLRRHINVGYNFEDRNTGGMKTWVFIREIPTFSTPNSN